MPSRTSFVYSDRQGVRFSCNLECGPCQGRKLNGQNCTRRVCVGLPYCFQHAVTMLNVQNKWHGPNKILTAVAHKDRRGRIVFKPKDVICDYIGEVIPRKEAVRRYGSSDIPYSNPSNSDSMVVDPACKRGIGSLIGYSNELGLSPNIEFKVSNRINYGGRALITLKAKKNIKDGEALVIEGGDPDEFKGTTKVQKVQPNYHREGEQSSSSDDEGSESSEPVNEEPLIPAHQESEEDEYTRIEKDLARTIQEREQDKERRESLDKWFEEWMKQREVEIEQEKTPPLPEGYLDEPEEEEITDYSKIPKADYNEIRKIYMRLTAQQKWDRMATLGHGVELAESTIPDAGNGVFATRPFLNGEWITEYSGKLISKQEAAELEKEWKSSHIYNARGSIYDALQIELKEGVGLGGFANAVGGPSNVPKSRRNCILAVREGQPNRKGYLRATKDIKVGDELITDYGNGYWKVKPQ
jgi:hypothetical protein